MAITLRQESQNGASTKGSALTFAELDNNFIHFMTNGITVVGDDSTGKEITLGNSIKFAGGDNVTVTVDEDSAAMGATVVNISATGASGLANVVEDTTPQLGGDLDVNSQSIVSTSDGNIQIDADGTGWVVIGNGTDSDFNTAYSSATHYHNGAVQFYQNSSVTPGTGTRHYANSRVAKITLDGSNSSSTQDRYRQHQDTWVDLNGSELTGTGVATGIMNTMGVYCENSGASAGIISEVKAINAEGYLAANNGTIQVTNMYGVKANLAVEGTNDHTLSNAYGFAYNGITDDSGGGTTTITNDYGFYYGNSSAGTNAYAFYSADDGAKSRVGTLQRYREQINALTSSSTITVDCNLSPVHTVTLGTNTEFNITNLSTGQSVTLIITQDGTGSRTATFGTDASTAVKFPGGAPTLSTAASSIDVVTVFNDGTNYLGNIAQAFA